MKSKNSNFDQFFDFINFCRSNRFQFDPSLAEASSDSIDFYKGLKKMLVFLCPSTKIVCKSFNIL